MHQHQLRRKATAALTALLSVLGVFVITTGSAHASAPDQPWVPGIDVSVFQGQINWPAVAASGEKFAYAKVSGSDPARIGGYCSPGLNYVDSTGLRNLAGAESAGMEVGAYHFACPGGDAASDGVNEATFFTDHGGCSGRMSPMLDLETSSLDAHGTVVYAQFFAAKVLERCKRPIIVYEGAYHLWSGQGGLNEWKQWLASYPTGYQVNPNPYANTGVPQASCCERPVIWQYTSSGRIPGIAGNVDRNVASRAWFDSVVSGIWSPTSGPVLATPDQVASLLESWGMPCTDRETAGNFWCVVRFQLTFGLPVDGVWGLQTQATAQAWLTFLLSQPRPQTPEEAALAFIDSCMHQTLRPDTSGPCVKLGQSMLLHAGYVLTDNGVYGAEMFWQVAHFQLDNGLPVDGILDPGTWVSLAK